jgi:hypothetical protein
MERHYWTDAQTKHADRQVDKNTDRQSDQQIDIDWTNTQKMHGQIDQKMGRMCQTDQRRQTYQQTGQTVNRQTDQQIPKTGRSTDGRT